ncbi:hypothetical protein QZH41_003444 [Actinostola sp. cb2023]|nr:hypothetical protein QZH41_003444 [Actinostola sp. cb2023]
MLEKNRMEARAIAVEEAGIESDTDTPVPITVSFDGTWAKRDLPSNHGIGYLIAADTGKVIDYAMESKIYTACQQQRSKLSEVEFNAWKENHGCLGDYKDSSPSMEAACARRIWNASFNYKIEYRFMVSDGDSKAYNEVWDIYGVCEECDKYENMRETSEEYLNWKQSPQYKEWEDQHLQGLADCKRVVKLDCVGHVQKRMGKALWNFQQDNKKASDGKSVKGKSGRLTLGAIQKLQMYYGRAIRNNVKKGPLSVEEKDNAVSVMSKEIKAGLYHSCKLPDSTRHQFCPNDSWCAYQKGGKVINQPHHLDAVFAKDLEGIYNRLSDSY